MKGISLVSRTLAELKKRGYVVPWRVEQWNTFGTCREDKWGCIDIDCLKRIPTIRALQEGVAYPMNYLECHIQVCDFGSRKSHEKKIRASEAFKYLMQTPCVIEIWAWHKVCKLNKDGKKSKVKEWQVIIEEIKEKV